MTPGLEIRNSAQLPSDWVAEDTGMMSRPHNPRIAQAFFRTGMIEAWGRGIRQITERCREAGNPTPTWTQEPGGVLCLRFPFGLTVKGVKYHFRKLREAGAIRRLGSSRAGHWEVL